MTAHNDAHHHSQDMPRYRLALAAAINVGFAAIQVTVGIITGSVVVLADSLHQVVDAVGLVTALVAAALANRSADNEMTYGWGKTDAVGAYTSGLLLLGSIAWVAYEAINRLLDPVNVAGPGVIAIGIAGIAVNGGSIALLGHGGHLAIKAARLHLIIDLAGSVLVVFVGAALIGTNALWIDPIASLAINIIVLRGTWRLLKASLDQLLDRSPHANTVADIAATLETHDSVSAVHHIHSRTIAPGTTSTTAHVVIDGDATVHTAQNTLHDLKQLLNNKLDINHTTIQIECHDCDDNQHLTASQPHPIRQTND